MESFALFLLHLKNEQDDESGSQKDDDRWTGDWPPNSLPALDQQELQTAGFLPSQTQETVTFESRPGTAGTAFPVFDVLDPLGDATTHSPSVDENPTTKTVQKPRWRAALDNTSLKESIKDQLKLSREVAAKAQKEAVEESLRLWNEATEEEQEAEINASIIAANFAAGVIARGQVSPTDNGLDNLDEFYSDFELRDKEDVQPDEPAPLPPPPPTYLVPKLPLKKWHSAYDLRSLKPTPPPPAEGDHPRDRPTSAHGRKLSSDGKMTIAVEVDHVSDNKGASSKMLGKEMRHLLQGSKASPVMRRKLRLSTVAPLKGIEKEKDDREFGTRTISGQRTASFLLTHGDAIAERERLKEAATMALQYSRLEAERCAEEDAIRAERKRIADEAAAIAAAEAAEAAARQAELDAYVREPDPMAVEAADELMQHLITLALGIIDRNAILGGSGGRMSPPPKFVLTLREVVRPPPINWDVDMASHVSLPSSPEPDWEEESEEMDYQSILEERREQLESVRMGDRRETGADRRLAAQHFVALDRTLVDVGSVNTTYVSARELEYFHALVRPRLCATTVLVALETFASLSIRNQMSYPTFEVALRKFFAIPDFMLGIQRLYHIALPPRKPFLGPENFLKTLAVLLRGTREELLKLVFRIYCDASDNGGGEVGLTAENIIVFMNAKDIDLMEEAEEETAEVALRAARARKVIECFGPEPTVSLESFLAADGRLSLLLQCFLRCLPSCKTRRSDATDDFDFSWQKLDIVFQAMDSSYFLHAGSFVKLCRENFNFDNAAMLKRLFSLFATYHGGRSMHLSQVVQCFSQLLHGTPMDRLKLYFSLLDLDGGGSIDMDEFITLVELGRKQMYDTSEEALQAERNKIIDVMKCLDQNNDGQIEYHEFTAVLLSRPHILVDVCRLLGM